MKTILPAVALTALLAAFEESVKPQLGTPAEQLLNETFNGQDLPKGWSANAGKLHVKNGELLASERSSDMHVGAFRYKLPLKDFVIQINVRLGEARTVNIGFDPSPGKLKKKGHLFSLVISKSSWSIVEHNDKSDPASKTRTLAKAEAHFESGATHTILLECKGNDVLAQASGKEPLKASSPDFHVEKPGLVFRVGGADGKEAIFDNIQVWQLK